MTCENIRATEKALLLMALGYLEALKDGTIHPDEAFHTIGIPQIVDRMAQFGVSGPVSDLVGQLDEFEPIRVLSGEAAHRQAINVALEECRSQLSNRPLEPHRANVFLRLLQPIDGHSPDIPTVS